MPQRDSFFTVDIERVDEWYAALKLFTDLLYEEAVYFKMDTGIVYIWLYEQEKMIFFSLN